MVFLRHADRPLENATERHYSEDDIPGSGLTTLTSLG